MSKGGFILIRSNLSVLLAERNLKISQVSKDTGISRTTLTALYYNTGQGIQFETLNKLCLYLKTTPEKIISFHPVDMFLNGCSLTGDELVLEFSLMNKGIVYEPKLFGHIQGEEPVLLDDDYPYYLYRDIYVFIDFFDSDNLSKGETILQEYINSLPTPFLTDFEGLIMDYVMENYKVTEDAQITIEWDI